MAKKKQTGKNNQNKLKELKIELLKQPQKKKSIKKEIARILTMENTKTKQGENK